MTFKEARAAARSNKRAYTAIGRFKDGGWFVDESGRDSRDLYLVEKDGSLIPLTEAAKKYLKKRGKGA